MQFRKNRPSTEPAIAREEKGSVPGSRGTELTAGVPLARIVPRVLARAPELVVAVQPRSFATERFRRLRAVLSTPPEGAPQVIVVSSAAPGEGKSVVAMNLALAFASEDRSETPLLVDADLRRPSVERWLNPHPKLGLSDLLTGGAPLDHAILRLEKSSLEILPAGGIPADPASLMASDKASELMSQLRTRYSRIILDTPPVVPFADAATIGRHGDGFILVVRCGITPVSAMQRAKELLTGTAPLLGTVLNDLEENLADRGAYRASKYYDSYYSKERKS
jgi:capsular exopolysaccharide synthesis family protein